MNKNSTQSAMVFGLVLIALGVLLLAGQFVRIDLGADYWPYAVIGVGGLFFVGMLAGGPAAGGLAIPGSIIAMTGLILLVQNSTSRFETWSYCWALLVAASGIGVVIRSYWSHMEGIRQQGWDTTRFGVMLFMLLGAFFELFIYQHTLAAQITWPVALIVFGGILVGSYLLKQTPHLNS